MSKRSVLDWFVIIIALVAIVGVLSMGIVWLLWKAYGWVAVENFRAPAIGFWKFWVGWILLGCVGRALFGRGSKGRS